MMRMWRAVVERFNKAWAFQKMFFNGFTDSTTQIKCWSVFSSNANKGKGKKSLFCDIEISPLACSLVVYTLQQQQIRDLCAAIYPQVCGHNPSLLMTQERENNIVILETNRKNPSKKSISGAHCCPARGRISRAEEEEEEGGALISKTT